jgi:Diacylglycerol kinase catalytic domain
MATLILNAWSGGGKYQPAIRLSAQRRGWVIREVGPGADPARLAASSDTDVLVVAGGDGTVSAVAAVAVERDLPLVVLPCGTLNHFAADAGLDCNDPLTGVSAVEDGTELRVDVGSVNGRVFINNASIGFYSSMVQDPQYRSRRVAVTSRYLRRAIRGGGTTMTVWLTVAPRVVVPDHVLTILVSTPIRRAWHRALRCVLGWTRRCCGCTCWGSMSVGGRSSGVLRGPSSRCCRDARKWRRGRRGSRPLALTGPGSASVSMARRWS